MAAKYKIMYDDMKQKILTGIWFENMLLPTEANLCEQYEVSRITTRHALEKLEEDSLIVRIQGRGNFVKPKMLKHGESAKGFVQMMADQGYLITTRILSCTLEPSTDEVANRLHINAGGKVWHFRRLRSIGSTPIVLMDAYVDEELGNKMNQHNLDNISFYNLYREILGKDIEETINIVTAFNPNDEICSILNVEKGSAHLLLRSTTLVEGTPIEYNITTLNANYSEFVVAMRDLRVYTSPRIR